MGLSCVLVCFVITGRLCKTAPVWEQGHRMMQFTLSHGTSGIAPVFVCWFVYLPCKPAALHWFIEMNSRHGTEEKWRELEEQEKKRAIVTALLFLIIGGVCLLRQASLLKCSHNYCCCKFCFVFYFAKIGSLTHIQVKNMIFF